MKRLGALAAELGWPVETLLTLPADEIERLTVVSDAWQGWIAAQIERQIAGE